MSIAPHLTQTEQVIAEFGQNPYLCYQCQRCASGCPTAQAMRYWPSKMVRLVQLGLTDRLLTDASVWRCLTCETCAVRCPTGVSPRQLVEALRTRTMAEYYHTDKRELLAGNEELLRGLRALGVLGERIHSAHNISGDDNTNRLIWSSNLPQVPAGLDRKEGAETVYFVGCVTSLFPMSYGIAQSFVTVLERAQANFTTLGGQEWCCGYPLLVAGLGPQVQELARHNVAQVKALGAKRIVVTCPSCYHVWHHVYPTLLGDEMDVPVVHATELLAEMVEAGQVRFKEMAQTVTYHDPCDLGRKSGVYDAPRRVIQSIPGLTFTEMARRRSDALCCGGGGNLETFDPALVKDVAEQRVAEAAQSKAAILVSACPQCERTLSKAARERKLRLRVMDVVELAERAMA
jgi:Fe-S oxidoreductase